VLEVSTREVESDAALLRSFAQREPGAAEALYERFSKRIYGLGKVLLRDDQGAQDLVQDTFVRMWRNADRYDATRGRLDTWVLLMARSIALDSLRRRVVESRSLESLGRPVEASGDAGPEEIAVDADLGARARSAIGSLPPEQRDALNLVYFGGKTSAEVAEIEGIPLGTAKTRIRTGLLRLRDALGAQT
jgi:RNA polymerase sigma-70 factor (ECF subfamily)